ncbi:MAG TPA: tripartite tricarboxylate transporter substrate-binding protein [Steroidobacteraceae bacterium]
MKADKTKVDYANAGLGAASHLCGMPTMDEAGLKGFEVGIWHAMYAPKGTPKPVIDKLVASLQEALKDATVKTRFNDLGTDPIALDKATPAALRAHLKTEIDKWGPLIRKAGVYAD